MITDFLEYVRNIEFYRNTEPYRTEIVETLRYLDLPVAEVKYALRHVSNSELVRLLSHAISIHTHYDGGSNGR